MLPLARFHFAVYPPVGQPTTPTKRGYDIFAAQHDDFESEP
jgi:hypothetical protein